MLDKKQTVSGTGFYAFTAAYAFRGTGYFAGGEGHRTCLFTGSAGGTLMLFPMNLHQAEAVEPAVDST